MSGGFTITEVLVALMILSVTAGTMTTAMGTAFKSYDRLERSSSGLREKNKLNQLMKEVSGHYWLADGTTKEKIMHKIPVYGPYFRELVIEADDYDNWHLYAIGKQIKKTKIITSRYELRFRAVGSYNTENETKKHPYDYHTIMLEQLIDGERNSLNREWQPIVSTPLKIDADPACQFDIVGRQCR